MNVTIYGAGYVGLVTAVCLAEIGHNVICVEVDQNKLKKLQAAIPTIFEKDLSTLLKRNLENKRLRFSPLEESVVAHGDIQIIAVGTPPSETEAVDMRYVKSAAEFIGQHLKKPAVIVNKSTVPVGTVSLVEKIIQQNLKTPIDFSVVSNPEFLREGRAIADCLSPERIIIGTNKIAAVETMKKLYQPFLDNTKARLFHMNPASAELTKYAANAFLAMKISFINEIAEMAEAFSADIDEIKVGIGSDSRIGMPFLNAGCGFGGSCFPKDVNALRQMGVEKKIAIDLLTSTLHRNHRQKQLLFEKINRHFNGEIKNKTFALWGLAFKPDTDDVREATSLTLIENLLKAGATIKAHDPMAMQNIKNILPQAKNIILCESPFDAAHQADALIIATEWNCFSNINLIDLKKQLKNPIVFDGRNIFNVEKMQASGFTYISIGREAVYAANSMEA